ncbi:hypothetical protein FG379_002445 [Cryptosporidium bovis]|uniref:uncharacterized protein n=1 Tax=Cryptosporidium bovis TaxID=310047 RepID=UPI00351A8B37|nr:hypothetical protein FG379_002445 [Cryptosporidium bovis]
MSSLQELLLRDLSEIENASPSNHNFPDNEELSDDDIKEEIERLIKLGRCHCGLKEDTYMGDDNLNEIYSLFQEIIDMISLVDKKIEKKYEKVKLLYKDYFPELSSIIINQMDYLEVVGRIITKNTISGVKLDDILPNSTIMTITISLSANKRSVPNKEAYDSIFECIKYSKEILNGKNVLLGFLQEQVNRITPNLSALVGPEISAILLCKSGGLRNLAEMPSQNIMVLGSNRNNKANGHFSTGPVRIELLQSTISQCDIIKNVPEIHKKKAIRLLSSKCGLCARIDLTSCDKNSHHGEKLRNYIVNMLEKVQEPPQKPLKKPLPVPKDFPKSKRGGRRIRKIKEKFKQTQTRKEMNRVKFGEEEEEYTVDGKTIGLGMLSKVEGRGRIKNISFKKIKISNGKSVNSNDTRNGNSSTISFTPYQGMVF